MLGRVTANQLPRVFQVLSTTCNEPEKKSKMNDTYEQDIRKVRDGRWKMGASGNEGWWDISVANSKRYGIIVHRQTRPHTMAPDGLRVRYIDGCVWHRVASWHDPPGKMKQTKHTFFDGIIHLKACCMLQVSRLTNTDTDTNTVELNDQSFILVPRREHSSISQQQSLVPLSSTD